MVEWLVGGGAILSAFSLIIAVPCAVGWMLDKGTGEQNSWECRWFNGAFVSVALFLLTFGPWAIGDFILAVTNGG